MTRAEWRRQTAHRRENAVLCHWVCGLFCLLVVLALGSWEGWI